MTNESRTALAHRLEQLAGASRRVDAGESAEAIADEVWPSFREAVATVHHELGADFSEALKRWQKARRAGQTEA